MQEETANRNIDQTFTLAEEAQKEKEEATRIRKYQPFAFSATSRYLVGPLDCCRIAHCDICFDTLFCPCCLWAKLEKNIYFARYHSRLYEETSSSDDDDENVGVVKSQLSRYEQRFSSDRSYYDCDACIKAGFACLPGLSFISTLCLADLIKDFNRTFGLEGKHNSIELCSVCCGADHADVGNCFDCLVAVACAYTLAGTTFTSLNGSFYARELRHRQLYDGGCISAATPQVPSRGWLRRRKVQLIKVHGKTRMKLALDIFRVAWFVSRFLPKFKNRYQFFDENLEIPQMV